MIKSVGSFTVESMLFGVLALLIVAVPKRRSQKS